MKNNPIQPTTETAKLPAAQSNTLATAKSLIARRIGVLACAVVGLLVAAGSSMAIDATVNGMTAVDGRLTVPIGSTNAYSSTISVTLGAATTTNDPAVATLSATGVPSTGGGAAVVFDSISVTNATTNTANINVNFTLNYTNLANGDYDMAIEATGSNTWRLPIPVKAGYQWSAGGGAGNISFTDPINWVGGVVPGPTDIVILSDAGLAGDSGTPTIGITNNTTIGSVSDVHTSSDYQHWNIAAGAALSVLGDEGWWHITDKIDSNDRKRVRGSGEGTLIISNANATFGLYHTRQNNSYDASDFSALNTMIVDVSRIAIHDGPMYPNNLTNGNMERPRRNIHDIDWAKTNILRATWTDTNNWATADSQYGLVLNRFFDGTPTGNDGGMHFKTWNEVYCDSILWGGLGAQMENPEVDLESDGYLKIRNTDNVSRVSNITIADNRQYFDTEDPVGGASKIDVVFDNGTVDILADTLYIGRAPNVGDGGQADGEIQVGAGTLDVNNAILGYQEGAGLGSDRGWARGLVQVEKGGVFRVNDTLVLGYTESTNPASGYNVEGGGGRVKVIGPGTAEINLITVGGVTKLSENNIIDITDGGNLIVTNTVGAADAPVNQLTMNDSTITLFLDAGSGTPYVYAKTLVTGGAGNTIKLASVTGLTTDPQQVPLIAYTDPAAPNFGLELPAGLYGYVVNNTGAGTIDAVLSATPPQSLVWDGNLSGNWDHSTANWQGGLVFVDGDGVTFDDSASGNTSVTVSGTVTLGAGGVLVSNDTKAYSLGGGTIAGSASITKEGTNTLTIDAGSALALIVNTGTVNGSGTLGTTTVETNGVLSYSGTINKLTTSGTTDNSGTVNNSVSVNGGVFNNSGTIAGTFSTSGGSVVSNTGNITIPSSGTVGSGTTLIHDGQLTVDSGSLVISGHLTGTGTVTDDTGVEGNRTILAGSGLFTPGGSNTIGTFVVEGTVDHNGGGMIVFDIDMNNPQTNDVLAVDNFDQFRAWFAFNNIGAIPFAAGQSFLVISNNFGADNEPGSPQKFSPAKIEPLVPGVGLQWDFSQFLTNGIVGVIAAPVSPAPTLMATTAGGTNQNFSWPSEYLGYQLQVQTNALAMGISTNWSPIVGSENTTSWSMPIDPANPTVFYRLSNQ